MRCPPGRDDRFRAVNSDASIIPAATRHVTETFRDELRAWLAAAFTIETADAIRCGDADERFDAHRAWNATLVDAGYGAIAWPSDHGGRDAGMREQLAYTEEMARVDAVWMPRPRSR